MRPKRNPLNLNALQLRTLTLLQELARLAEYSRPGEARELLQQGQRPELQRIEIERVSLWAHPL